MGARARITRRRPDESYVQQIRELPGGTTLIRTILQRGVVLTVGVFLLYLMQQRLITVVTSAEQLKSISGGWFAVMVLCEVASFAFMWGLVRQMLPGVSWFVAATSQLVSNSVSRVVPGGAAVGGATLYRMLSVSGIAQPQAASAMAATGILSTAMLFAIPAVATVLALLGAPMPERMLPTAIAGGVIFAVLMVLGVVAFAFTTPLRIVADGVSRVVALLGRLVRRPWTLDPDDVIGERDRLVEVLGARWLKAITASAGNWAFDYLALVAALYAVDAEPRLSLVLLAYASAAVLNMVPFTPGGVGFVEVGLYSTLVISGIPSPQAALATIAYRMVSLWFPVASGLVAWIAFKARFPSSGRPGREPERQRQPAPAEAGTAAQ
ncbi:MAG: flippase-like domain-containing protein [Acidimicrobiia bacterium]|nr:flippase-like domain-containing protein [Acidimicrobiia bacterium]